VTLLVEGNAAPSNSLDGQRFLDIPPHFHLAISLGMAHSYAVAIPPLFA
jgi:hypothetical protein